MDNDSLYSGIGARMRALRQAQKRTQADVAESAGIESSFYGQIERGANVPSLRTLLAVSAALGVGPADLLPVERQGPADAYSRIIESMMEPMSDKQRRVIVGIVRDIAAELGYGQTAPKRRRKTKRRS